MVTTLTDDELVAAPIRVFGTRLLGAAHWGAVVLVIPPQTAPQRAGARFSSNATPWTGHVVVDRELVTGQKPASALEVGQRLVERLK